MRCNDLHISRPSVLVVPDNIVHVCFMSSSHSKDSLSVYSLVSGPDTILYTPIRYLRYHTVVVLFFENIYLFLLSDL